MSISYVDRWSLHEDGQLEASFRDSPSMKIITSSIDDVDSMEVVYTQSGCAYVIGQPLYSDDWPGDIPARAINQALYYSIQMYRNNIRGDSLWQIFQDELATLFAMYRF
jgi:hypothetical protein